MFDNFFRNIERSKLGKLINRETVSYAFWGVATTLLNLGVFYILEAFGVDYRIANITAIMCAKAAAYLTSKFFVFKSRCDSMGELFGELFRFILSRLFTMALDYAGLIMLVDFAGLNPRIGKIVTTVVVIIINYFAGKLAVFKKRKHGGLL